MKPAAQKLKVERKTIYGWINGDEELKQALADIRESMIDMSEGALYKLIQEGNPAGIFFHLKTQGKERGYIEKQEIDHTTGGDKLNEIKINWPTEK